MLTVAKLVPFAQEVDILEALAIWDSLGLVREMGFMRMEVEFDSAKVISLLRSETSDVSDLGALAEEIKQLARGFQFCSFRWCRRSANKVAHELARSTLELGREGTWLEEVPVEIEGVYFSEVLDSVSVLSGRGCFV